MLAQVAVVVDCRKRKEQWDSSSTAALLCQPENCLWVAHAVWPAWGYDREKHDRHSLGLCTIRRVTARLNSVLALWGRQLGEHCREVRRRFMSKMVVIALKAVTDETWSENEAQKSTAFCPHSGISK